MDRAAVGVRPAHQPALHAEAEPAAPRATCDDFVDCYAPGKPRGERVETERFRSFTYDELVARDKANLDITWLQGRLPGGPGQPARPGGHRPGDRRGPDRRAGRVRGRRRRSRSVRGRRGTRVSIPDYQSLMAPVLHKLVDGHEHAARDIAADLARELGLTDAELAEVLPSGKITVWRSRVHLGHPVPLPSRGGRPDQARGVHDHRPGTPAARRPTRTGSGTRSWSSSRSSATSRPAAGPRPAPQPRPQMPVRWSATRAPRRTGSRPPPRRRTPPWPRS